MIIFDLDGTLADCEHRRHFVDPRHPKNIEITSGCTIKINSQGYGESNHQINKFTPDWKSFYEACDKDEPIVPTIRTFIDLFDEKEIKIWSGRCESVREKTTNWLIEQTAHFLCRKWIDKNLKMRPIGDYTPDDQLKEKWLNEYIDDMGNQIYHDIEFVFDSDKKSIQMWRIRGIFVFDCNQIGSQF